MTMLAPDPTATVLDVVVKALTRAAAYNANDHSAPSAVLWPDREQQWRPLLPLLRARLPLLTLGTFDAAVLSGPAIWLRCVVDGTILPELLPAGGVPIIYLPDYARADLRAVEECPAELQPLAELQYRGTIWSHKNGKDWSVAAFLQSTDGGLGLHVDLSAETREALQRALPVLAEQRVAALRAESKLDASFFDQLLNPDGTNQLLRWLNDPQTERARMTDETWAAFRSQCQKVYGFHPEKDGPLSAARRLGERKLKWRQVWNHFTVTAAAYPNIPALLASVAPSQAVMLPMFEERLPFPGRDDPQSSWPNYNDQQEELLQGLLRGIASKSIDDGRATIVELNRIHGPRREWVWADLGRSPLANALEPLATLGELSSQSLSGTSIDSFAGSWAASGWRVDAAAIDALLAVRSATTAQQQAVKTAVDALYRPWLTEKAERFQQLVATQGYTPSAPPVAENGTCILFTDGLRFDFGQRLSQQLASQQLETTLEWRLSALPTLTPTAKPHLQPVGIPLTGSSGFNVSEEGALSGLTADRFRGLLRVNGIQTLSETELGDPSGMAWTELGAIDQYGHGHGWKVAYHAIDELREIGNRIGDLLAHGWKRVIVITDHGWLMLPEPLPKTNLPSGITEPRKQRCARIHDLATVELQTVPWRWDSAVRVAMAPGISCFTAGYTYEHGGLSVQECVTPHLIVTAGAGHPGPVDFTRIQWRQLKCTVTIAGGRPDLTVDLRRQAGDAASSVANKPKSPDPDGTAALFVDDEDLIGAEVLLVVLDADGQPLVQRTTRIGGSD